MLLLFILLGCTSEPNPRIRDLSPVQMDGMTYFSLGRNVYLASSYKNSCPASFGSHTIMVLGAKTPCKGHCLHIPMGDDISMELVDTFFTLLHRSLENGPVCLTGSHRFMGAAMFLYKDMKWSRARIFLTLKDNMVGFTPRQHNQLLDWFSSVCEDRHRSADTISENRRPI